MTIFYFLFTLGVLIFIHELGHFVVAKLSGVRVEAFSLGFGPRLFGFKRGDTDYRISLFPLGGYVKMLGEDPADDGAKQQDSFSAQSVWKRAAIAAFGPIMNIVLCVILMPIVFMVGRMQPEYLQKAPVVSGIKSESPAQTMGFKVGDKIIRINDHDASNWEDVMNIVLMRPNDAVTITIERKGLIQELTGTTGELKSIKGGYLGIEPMFNVEDHASVDGLSNDGPAKKAGIEVGDIVVSYAGSVINNFMDLAAKVNEVGGKESRIRIKRGNSSVTKTITPVYNEGLGRWLLGVTHQSQSVGPQILRHYGFAESLSLGMKEVGKLTGLTFDVLKRLVTLKLSYKSLGGPVIIAKVSAQAAKQGLGDYLYFMAFLSIQLAILNLLPIPVLDGGHLMFLAIEKIKGSPVNEKFVSIVSQVGFILLMGMMVLITIKDVEQMWGVSQYVKQLFGN